MKHTEEPVLNLFSASFLSDGTLAVHIGGLLIIVLVAVLAIWLLVRWRNGGLAWQDFEINEAEIGTGNGKIKFKPNMTDRQVAYAVWVELSTRKIGLPIDFEHDVIAEIYDSWYGFFGVTRDLVKSIPVAKVQSRSTQTIVKLSIEILNEGLRPHLTHWQARFRRWYEYQLTKESGDLLIDPQDIQKRFPRYEELAADMERVNKYLMRYREEMRRLVMNKMPGKK